MLAGYIPEAGRIELVDVPEPELPPRNSDPDSPGDIIFQPECSCLCGSDLPFLDGSEGQFPQELGHSLHEMTGRVIATNGDRFQPGQRVLAVPLKQLGLFERYVISEDRAIPLDDRIPEEQALLAQPLGTVLYALKKLPTVLDKDVVVVGQGPIGQLFCAAVRNLGARHIIAVDLLESRLKTSPHMGATETVCNATEDPIAAVSKITDGHMADIVIEVVGHEDQALNLCIDLARQDGRILYFGVPPTHIDAIRWRDLFFKNLTIHTSVNPDFRRDFPLAMRWIAEGRIDVSKIITHHYPLAEIQTAFETFRDRVDGALKVFVEFPAWEAGRTGNSEPISP